MTSSLRPSRPPATGPFELAVEIQLGQIGVIITSMRRRLWSRTTKAQLVKVYIITNAAMNLTGVDPYIVIHDAGKSSI